MAAKACSMSIAGSPLRMNPLNELKVAVPPPASWLKVPPFGRLD
jgi:hypothetical protein